MTTVVLDAERVERIFLDCLFKDGEDTSNHVVAEGIMQTVGFNPERLESYRSEIEALLDELPDEFKASGGGGWTSLNACMDRHGSRWTGLTQRIEQLIQLGIAIGNVEYQLPRDTWSSLPSGMPYIVIK